MIRRSTLVVILILIAVIGFSLYFNKNKEKQATIDTTLTPQTQTEYLFNAADGTPIGIRVESKTGEVVELARNADKAWALIKPIEASAEQGSAEAAATQITAIAVSDHVSNVSPKDVGLDAPDFKITVTFTNNVERIAEIGVVTPTGNGYYARVGNDIVIVSKTSIDALTGILTNPPYAETLTPSPIPATATETPLPPTPEPATATSESSTPQP